MFGTSLAKVNGGWKCQLDLRPVDIFTNTLLTEIGLPTPLSCKSIVNRWQRSCWFNRGCGAMICFWNESYLVKDFFQEIL
ncbi:hypothetical protein D0T08_00585 [Emticicia sp. C21]|nr:hypothetical protein D0T08_00585 [Emticicia sp. C21]